MGIALDTGDLDKAVDRVAGQPEMMLEAHFGGVFNLSDGAAVQLGGGCRSHGASCADFPLATHFGAGN